MCTFGQIGGISEDITVTLSPSHDTTATPPAQPRTFALVIALLAALTLAAPYAIAQSPADSKPGAQTGETTASPAPAPPSTPSEGPAPAGAPQSAETATPPAQPQPAPGSAQPAPVADQPAPDAAPATPVSPSPAPVSAPHSTKGIALRIAASDGAYGQAQRQVLFTPFAKREGYEILPFTFDGTYQTLKARGGDWDLVNLDGASVSRACKDELLEPLDVAMLQSGSNGTPAADDFLPGAIQPCAIASVAWSAVIVYDKTAKKEPTKVADFFDLRRFPGKRLLPKNPRFVLEFTLLADGVAPADVYSVLSTQEGQDRAFAKLIAMRDRIQWYDKSAEVSEQLGRKDASMAITFSGRAFMAIVNARRPTAILWDRQIYVFDYWGIPRGARNAAAARDFIRFATSSEQIAGLVRQFPYGPARRSALRLVGKHAELDLDLAPFLPTYEPNMRGALAFDGAWWDENEAKVRERFNALVEGREVSAPQSAPR